MGRFCGIRHSVNRRDMLKSCCAGFGSVALAGLFAEEAMGMRPRGDRPLVDSDSEQEYQSDKPRAGATTWVRVKCCGKWREIPASDEKICQEYASVKCSDLQTDCTVRSTYDPRIHGYLVLSPVPHRGDSGDGFQPAGEQVHAVDSEGRQIGQKEEAFAFEGVSKKVAMSDAEWYESGMTNREVYMP